MATADDLPELDLPLPPADWRTRLTDWAESLDLSLTRLVVGGVLLTAVALAGWRLLDPAEPAEMQLPMVTAGAESTADDGAENPGAGGASGDTARPPGGGEAAVDPVSASSAEDRPEDTDTGGAEVVVHIAGSVREPGVQRLDASARLIDAVEAAGGAADGADLARVNLAGELSDGQHIYIPAVDEEPPAVLAGPGRSTGPGPTGGTADGAGGAEGPPVNVNTAGLTELETLPGVGPAIGQAILDHRDRNGPFGSVGELTEVRGIGDAKLEGLRDHARV